MKFIDPNIEESLKILGFNASWQIFIEPRQLYPDNRIMDKSYKDYVNYQEAKTIILHEHLTDIPGIPLTGTQAKKAFFNADTDKEFTEKVKYLKSRTSYAWTEVIQNICNQDSINMADLAELCHSLWVHGTPALLKKFILGNYAIVNLFKYSFKYKKDWEYDFCPHSWYVIVNNKVQQVESFQEFLETIQKEYYCKGKHNIQKNMRKLLGVCE